MNPSDESARISEDPPVPGRPVIGITSNFGVNQDETPREQSYLIAGFADAVFQAGGLALPLPVPPRYNQELIDEILDLCAGLVLSGGYDLDPARVGQQPHPKTHVLHPRREVFEADLFARADQRRVPMLGVCLGHQFAHVVRGGGLIQHIPNEPPEASVAHYASGDANAFHDVRIEPGTMLESIVGSEPIAVPSRHHQIPDPDRLGRGLRTSATSIDGVIEASEDCDGRFLLTVQWHPEALLEDARHMALFAQLVSRARQASV